MIIKCEYFYIIFFILNIFYDTRISFIVRKIISRRIILLFTQRTQLPRSTFYQHRAADGSEQGKRSNKSAFNVYLLGELLGNSRGGLLSYCIKLNACWIYYGCSLKHATGYPPSLRGNNQCEPSIVQENKLNAARFHHYISHKSY